PAAHEQAQEQHAAEHQTDDQGRIRVLARPRVVPIVVFFIVEAVAGHREGLRVGGCTVQRSDARRKCRLIGKPARPLAFGTPPKYWEGSSWHTLHSNRLKPSASGSARWSGSCSVPASGCKSSASRTTTDCIRPWLQRRTRCTRSEFTCTTRVAS